MRQKRTRVIGRMDRTPDDDEPPGSPEGLAHWLLRMETGWGMPHDIVVFAASIVVAVQALPTTAERMAAAWRRLRG